MHNTQQLDPKWNNARIHVRLVVKAERAYKRAICKSRKSKRAIDKRENYKDMRHLFFQECIRVLKA